MDAHSALPAREASLPPTRRDTTCWPCNGANSGSSGPTFVNPPGTPYHEFYLVEIPNGELSPSSASCGPGCRAGAVPGHRFSDPGRSPARTGSLAAPPAPPSVPSCHAGGGRGLRALRDAGAGTRGAGEELDLSGPDTSLVEQYGPRFHYVPFVSREPRLGAMAGRIPAAIASGRSRQARVGVSHFHPNTVRMICGNPAMGEGDPADPAGAGAGQEPAPGPPATSAWRITGKEAIWPSSRACRHPMAPRHGGTRAAIPLPAPFEKPLPAPFGAAA